MVVNFVGAYCWRYVGFIGSALFCGWCWLVSVCYMCFFYVSFGVWYRLFVLMLGLFFIVGVL